MFEVNNKDTRTTLSVVLVSLLLTLNIFHTLSSVSIVNFEQVNAGWGVVKSRVTSEDKTKFNNFISPNRFSCLKNYSQFENSIDFNKEIAHNVRHQIN